LFKLSRVLRMPKVDWWTLTRNRMFCGYIGNVKGRISARCGNQMWRRSPLHWRAFIYYRPSPEMLLEMREAGSYCASRCRDAVTGKNVCLSKKAKENNKKGKKSWVNVCTTDLRDLPIATRINWCHILPRSSNWKRIYRYTVILFPRIIFPFLTLSPSY
jgi:hypothetical protein